MDTKSKFALFYYKLLINLEILKTIKTFTLGILLVLVAVACQSKNGYLKQFEKFVTTVEQDCANYSTEDWAGADAQFQAFTETEYQKYEDKLNPEDQNRLGRLVARYAKVRYRSAMQQAGDYVEDVMDEVEGFVEEMEEDLDE